MMIIDNKFQLGDFVYIKSDIDQRRRLIIGITIRPSGLVCELNYINTFSWHFEIELSIEKDIMIATTN